MHRCQENSQHGVAKIGWFQITRGTSTSKNSSVHPPVDCHPSLGIFEFWSPRHQIISTDQKNTPCGIPRRIPGIPRRIPNISDQSFTRRFPKKEVLSKPERHWRNSKVPHHELSRRLSVCTAQRTQTPRDLKVQREKQVKWTWPVLHKAARFPHSIIIPVDFFFSFSFLALLSGVSSRCHILHGADSCHVATLNAKSLQPAESLGSVSDMVPNQCSAQHGNKNR